MHNPPQVSFRIHKNPKNWYCIVCDNYDITIPPISCNSAETMLAYGRLLFSESKIESKIAGFVYMLRLLVDPKAKDICNKIAIKLVHCLNYFS